MKNFNFILPICMLFAVGLSAQQELTKFNCFNHEIGDTLAIFGDKVNVRKEANKDADILDHLYIGNYVKLLEKTDLPLTIGTRTDVWYKVGYGKDLTEKTGYIWGGIVAVNHIKTPDAVFVVQFAPAKSDTLPGTVELRAAQLGKMLSSAKWDAMIATEDYSLIEALDNKGLENCKNVIMFSFQFDACGYAQKYFYANWSGQKLIPLPMIASTSDSGYFFSQNYIFPNDPEGQGSNRIMLEESQGQPLEEDDYGYDSCRKVRELKWNGSKYILPKISWE